MSVAQPAFAAAVIAMGGALTGFAGTLIGYTVSRRRRRGESFPQKSYIEFRTSAGRDIHIPVDLDVSAEEKAKIEEIAKTVAEQLAPPENGRESPS